MKKGRVIFNLKNYLDCSIQESLKILGQLETIRDNRIYLAPPINSLDYLNSKKRNCKIIAQSTSVINAGAFTGNISLEILMKNKVNGTLLNHSEKRISKELVKEICFSSKNGFETIACCENIIEGLEFQKYDPSYIAYEPKELIGSGISVSTAKPRIVSDFCEKIKNPLIGAGITSIKDVEKGVELGAKGFLIASAFVKAKDKKKYAKNILEVLNTI